MIYLLTLAGHVTSIFIIAGYALAARQPWGFTSSWWLLLPPAAIPVMIIGGLLIGEKVHRRWVAISVAFATYVLLAIPLYAQAKHFTVPVAVDTGREQHDGVDHAAAFADLHRQRVRGYECERPGRAERQVPEVFHDHVEGRQPSC